MTNLILNNDSFWELKLYFRQKAVQQLDNSIVKIKSSDAKQLSFFNIFVTLDSGKYLVDIVNAVY